MRSAERARTVVAEAQRCRPGREDEIAGGVEIDALGTFEGEADLGGIGAGSDDKVELELSLATVIDEIDTRIDVAVADFRVGRDVRPPLRWIVAEEVVDRARQRLQPHDVGTRRGSRRLQTERRRPFVVLVAQDEHRLARRQEERIALATREEPHARVGLPAIGFEVQRKSAVSLDE